MDGERGSNSLSLEKDLDWSGLLAEGDPSNVKILKYERKLSLHLAQYEKYVIEVKRISEILL